MMIARLAEVEHLISWIASEPATNARRLRGSPEGIDTLIRRFEGLRSDLKHPDGFRWTWSHSDDLHHLLGLRTTDLPVSRAKMLGDALCGDSRHLASSDGEGLVGLDRQLWAGRRLVELIDAEVEALRGLREKLDHEGLAIDRPRLPTPGRCSTTSKDGDPRQEVRGRDRARPVPGLAGDPRVRCWCRSHLGNPSWRGTGFVCPHDLEAGQRRGDR